MEKFIFKIDNKEFEFPTDGAPEFRYGGKDVVSALETDITFGQKWYKSGYSIFNFLEEEEFHHLKEGLTNSVEKIIREELGINTNGFRLESYHEYVTSDEDHYKVILKTRDLYLREFKFLFETLFRKFEDHIGFGLTDIDPKTKEPIYIIVRINRPGSNDFNPPHKDVYHFMDGPDSYIPQFLNIWIPISGVTPKSSLPLVESSHLLPESSILRTTEGGVIGKNKYNVRMVKEWAKSNQLKRTKVTYGEALIFSSHLVHGLAVNEEQDTTRVSLEFRLFKK
ncbi:hypothetical protein [Pontibacter amylolyticus]|uniref:Phytanoyl-CoA dioxygenase n=1 Tax=Pontibacter amylolyticus TaxID=1424080 RepID=A0ABQ1WB28_9BACT|nr:hypothetical protein [Pontibacter amylolyticus]GGG22562.1 hypothetical protein GCM10011323_28140 [Pontibacter amylolyticus]